MQELKVVDTPDYPMEIVQGIVVPTNLNKSVSTQQYMSKLEMLALSAHSDNAFMYNLQTNHPIFFGNAEDIKAIDFSALAHSLSKTPQKLKIIEYNSDQEPNKIAMMLLSDENKQAIALLGSGLRKNEKPNSRRSYDRNNLSGAQKKLLSLVMLQFQEQLIADAKAQQSQVVHSQHLQLSALNQDYICIKDNAHRLVYGNPAYISSFPEQVQSSLIGNNNCQYYSPETSARIIDADISALSVGWYKGVQRISLAAGTEKILQISKKSFVGIDGKKYLMSVARDITEKEILINDLKRSNADLDNFAYVASHDLKAPLNAIKRLVSWVKEDCDAILPDESKDDLAIVLNRAQRMEKLLNDLLSYSRIGKEYQSATTINLHDFVVELLSLIDLPMGFVMNCSEVYVTVPVIPFNVVMLNLVSNAIKHHDSTNAKIEIKAKCHDKGCVVTIEDNGPGIEEKNRERIFKLFETLKPRDQVEGSGMGLSVVKKIVEHYGGSIKVESNKPRGTKFIVTWPTNNIARSVLDNLHD